MGYSGSGEVWPLEQIIRNEIESDTTSLLYEISHGGSSSFLNGCTGEAWTRVEASEVEAWLEDHTKMPFVFLASCGALCDTGRTSLSFAFHKGSNESTTVVGYCHMDEQYCSDCWTYSLDWQNAFFGFLASGMSVKDAVDATNAIYPMCGYYECMRFVGDENFAIVPVVRRDPWEPRIKLKAPAGGEVVFWGDTLRIVWEASDNGSIQALTVVFSIDGGMSFCDTLGRTSGEDSLLVWIVPQIETDEARIKIVALDGAGNQGSDMSGDFTLENGFAGLYDACDCNSSQRLRLEALHLTSYDDWIPVRVSMPKSGHVSLDFYDVTGRKISRVFDGFLSYGVHIIRCNWPKDAKSGVLFLRATSTDGRRTVKIIKVN